MVAGLCSDDGFADDGLRRFQLASLNELGLAMSRRVDSRSEITLQSDEE